MAGVVITLVRHTHTHPVIAGDSVAVCSQPAIMTGWCNLGNASISRPAVAMVRRTVLITVIVLDLQVSVSIGKQMFILFKLSLIQCVYSVYSELCYILCCYFFAIIPPQML